MVADSNRYGTRAIDIAEMQRLLSNDDELLRELLELFLDVYPECLSEIQQAVTACDSNAVRETAHRFKGSLRQIQARQAADAASELERAGREQGPPQDVLFKFERLLRDVASLCDEIQLLVSSD